MSNEQSKWAEQWDSELRWAVRSQSEKKIYVVDLGEWECQCTRAICNKQALKVKEGGRRLDPDNLCFHKLTALRTFQNEIMMPRIKDIPILREFLKPELGSGLDTLSLAFIDHMHTEEEQ